MVKHTLYPHISAPNLCTQIFCTQKFCAPTLSPTLYAYVFYVLHCLPHTLRPHTFSHYTVYVPHILRYTFCASRFTSLTFYALAFCASILRASYCAPQSAPSYMMHSFSISTIHIIMLNHLAPRQKYLGTIVIYKHC